jgi:DNA-nicking Smr family endonuclease
VRERRLSAEEAALWARVVASVEPLDGRAPKPPIPTEVEEPAKPKPVSIQARTSPSLGVDDLRAVARPAANTLDGSWDRRLSRGAVPPDLAIDLHGHNLQSAYTVLDSGLEEAIRRGARVLLLVTGKPREPGSGRGAIRSAVGDWLAASRHAGDIAAVRGAHPRHGGAGALYIILRKRRGAA